METENTPSIGTLVRKAEQNYISGTTNISKYVQFSMYENIEKIEAYLNSKHTSGETDSLGRDKPFFNIVTGAVNIWYRATDLDRKDIHIKPTKGEDILASFLMTAKLQRWMRDNNFGAFLNDWGRSLARYGSTVLKFVEQDGKLYPMVIPWNRLIVDSVSFDDNIKIEVLELNESQLRQKKGYKKEAVDALCNSFTARQTLGKQNKDNQNDFVKVYEVHGVLPLSTLKRSKGEEVLDGDDDIYMQQMHVISFVEKEKKGEYEDFTLQSGKENKDPYMITHLIREDGRTQSIGAVEHLFEAQWMMNHSVKAIKDQLDLASKLIFQSADSSFAGQNALLAIENGDIMTHADGKPLTQLQNNSHDITALQNFGAQWKALAQEITSTPDAISGNTMPSGTAYRQVAILNQESHSLFEMMIENKGLALEDMLRFYILPFIKKNELGNAKEIIATLDDYGIKQVESTFIKNEAVNRLKRHVVDSLLAGKMPMETVDSMQAQVAGELQSQGNHRSIKPSDIDDTTWKEVFKDIEWDVEVDITGESSNKEVAMTTLTTLLQTIAGNPMVLQDPNAKLLFNKILTTAGEISPLELSSVPPAPAPVPQAPQAPMPTPTPAPATPTGS